MVQGKSGDMIDKDKGPLVMILEYYMSVKDESVEVVGTTMQPKKEHNKAYYLNVC